jgi:hypothetical protein
MATQLFAKSRKKAEAKEESGKHIPNKKVYPEQAIKSVLRQVGTVSQSYS